MSVRGDTDEPANQELDCTVREATFGDYEAICQVKLRNGLEFGDYSRWSSRWIDNPCRREFQVPIGWVLESKTQGIVGTFSNLPRMYSLNSEPVRAAIPSAWAVDRHFRYAASTLAEMYLAQKNIDLFITTTASPRTEDRLKALNCIEIPGPSCAEMLFWITNYVGFAEALLRKVRAPALAGIRHTAGAALYLRDLAHRPRVRYQRMEICLLTSFDARFDALWEQLRRRRNRLMAVRSGEALSWQFRPVLESGNLVILGLMEGNSLTGYLIMRKFDLEQYGLRRFRIVDIQAIGDESNALLSLMSAALEHAARSGADVLEAMGFNKSKHDLLERLHPHHRSLPSFPYLYQVSADSPSLQDALQGADAWDPSPLDGDAAL
ncbi:MAG: hypothetical protein ABSA48_10080 [Terracidiphilus sp.]|jgi:hypothetical protein